MTVDEINAALASALPLRPPTFHSGTSARQKIDALEEYLLHSAFVAAELEEALHWTDALIAHFADKIARIEGYQPLLPAKRTERITQADINAAKRQVDPESFELGAGLKQSRESLRRQIERLRFEEQWVVSRAYSMISGS